MGRFLLSTLGTIALLISVELIDGGALGLRVGALIDRLTTGSIPASVARLLLAFALATLGVLILGVLLWNDQSPRAAYRRRNLIRSLVNVGWFTAILTGLGATVLYLEKWDLTRSTVAQIVFSGFLSGAVGFGELIQRYRDDPQRLLASAPTAIYVCVNAVAGVGALALVKHFDVFSTGPNKNLYEVLLAGFSAIAFFRTSLFTAKVGDADVGIGPATLLKSLLDSSDRMTDREQAVARGEAVAAVMTKIDFDKAKAALPTSCFTLVENSNTDQQEAVGQQIAKLDANATMNSDAKVIILGVYLLRQVGAPVLNQAIETLGEKITKSSVGPIAEQGSPAAVDRSARPHTEQGNASGGPASHPIKSLQSSATAVLGSTWRTVAAGWYAKASPFAGAEQSTPSSNSDGSPAIKADNTRPEPLLY